MRSAWRLPLLLKMDLRAVKEQQCEKTSRISSAWTVLLIAMMRARTDVKRPVLLEERSLAQTLPLTVRRRNAERRNTRAMLSINAIWDRDAALHLASKVVTLLGIERLY